MFKYNTQTLFISPLKNKYIQEVKGCSLHTPLFLESTRLWFRSSWGFLRGCHRSSDTSSELPCVGGSHRLTHTKVSERVIWNWDGNSAPGHETKEQLKILFPILIFSLHGARADKFYSLLWENVYQQYHLITQKIRQAPKFRMNFRRVGRTALLLEICNNILLLYDAISLPPMLPGTILTSCPWKSKSLC